MKNKLKDKKEQKREAEQSIEAIRRFNQINEEIKKSCDEQVAKPKTSRKEYE